MQQLAAGQDLALNVLMQRWQPRLTAYLMRMTGQHSSALDLAQATFVRLYQARHRYRPQAAFPTYLFTIASRLAHNHARWAARHPTVSLDSAEPPLHDPADPQPDPAAAAVRAERLQEIQAALSALPVDLRTAMVLFAEHGLGYAEISTILDCSPKAVETRLYRARQLLRQSLAV